MHGFDIKRKRIIHILSLLITLCLVSALLGTVAFASASNDVLEIKLRLKNTTMYVNSVKTKIEMPFIKNSTVYIPLNAVFDAIGAEINQKAGGMVNIIYRSTSTDIKTGSLKYTLNQKDKQFKSAPVAVKGTVMVPLDFVRDDFGLKTSFNKTSGEIKILLEDDGALSDLSFLTDSISKPIAGNSYFNWNIRVPNGSRLQNVSFNSKDIVISNELRGITLEISVDTSNKKTLSQLFDEIKKDPISNFGSKIIESTLNSKQTPYAEFLYINPEEEAVIKRLFISNGNLYNVSLASYDEIDPKKLKGNKYYRDILDSFKLVYDTTSKDIQDLSSVKYGYVKYENYAVLASEIKYFTWDMNVIPEWNLLKASASEPLQTKIGTGSKEYIAVNMKKPDDIETLDDYVSELVDRNKKDFNPKKYSFIEKSKASIAGYNSVKVVYTLEMGGSKYVIDTHYILKNNLIYVLTIKAKEDRYKEQKTAYYKMLESIKFQPLKMQEFEKDMDDFAARYGNIKVGEDGEIADIQNKKYNWSIKMPGYWMKDNLPDENLQMFMHPYTDITFSVESVENSSRNSQLSDDEKFTMMGSVIKKYKMKLIAKETYQDKNKSAKVYKYRLESEDDEIYADVKYYVIDKEKYSYCLCSIISDVYSVEQNIKEAGDMVESFKSGE